MRIGIGVINYRPALGGSARGVQMLAEGMARRGHQVTIVTQAEPNCPERETLDGVGVIRLRMHRFGGKRVPAAYLRTLHSLRTDVLHINGNNIWSADWFFPVAGWFKVPKVLTAHGYYHWHMSKGIVRNIYHNIYLPNRLLKFDAYVAQTQGEIEHVVRRGYPRERVHLICTGVDPKEFYRPPPAAEKIGGFDNGTKVALTISAQYDNKRVDRLVRAVGSTAGEWALVVIGPDVPGHPYDMAHCQEVARQSGANVKFLGAVDRPTVLQALATADAYVQGSEFEGFGLALLEAMAADLPFVAFDAGAARDFAVTGAGKVVTSENEMAGYLRSIPEWYKRGTGRKTAAGYSTEETVEKHLRLYESLL